MCPHNVTFSRNYIFVVGHETLRQAKMSEVMYSKSTFAALLGGARRTTFFVV